MKHDGLRSFMFDYINFMLLWFQVLNLEIPSVTFHSCYLFIDIFHSSITREFVNNVWCIKILSPPELQQMGKRGIELLNSVPIQRLSNSSCDDYASRQDSRNLSSGITSVGSLDYWSIWPVNIRLSSVILLSVSIHVEVATAT